ncbi:hypothetical protein XENOCAPTIV_014098, partial [Xenoophorus captivus]
MLRVANSTPMVLLLSRLNSFRVKRDSSLLSPITSSGLEHVKSSACCLVRTSKDDNGSRVRDPNGTQRKAGSVSCLLA